MPRLFIKNNKRVGEKILLMLIILCGIFFSHIDINRSIWADEAFSVYTASQDLNGITNTVINDSGPPFYYLLLALWTRIFGITEYAVRSLSLFFYILSIIAIYLLGKSFYNNSKTGLLCSFLYATNLLAINHAQNARMYSMLGFLSILSILFFLKIFYKKSDSPLYFIFYIVINIIGLFTHYWFLFIILSEIITFTLLLSGRSLFKKFATSIFISIVPFSVLWFHIVLLQINTGATSWIRKPGLMTLLDALLYFYSGKPALIIYFIFLLLLIVKFNGKVRLQKLSTIKCFIMKKQTLISLIFFFSSLVLPWIISHVQPIFSCRCLIIALPPFVLLMASFLKKFTNKSFVLFLSLVLIMWLIIYKVKETRDSQKSSDRLTAKCLIKETNENDVLIFTSLSRLAIDYYLDLLVPEKKFIRISFPSEINAHPGWRNVKKMLNNKYPLEREADSIIGYLHTISDSATIWLFYGWDKKITNIIKERLDLNFSFKEKKPFSGSFYKTILIYNDE